jgi:hypothetical protein
MWPSRNLAVFTLTNAAPERRKYTFVRWLFTKLLLSIPDIAQKQPAVLYHSRGDARKQLSFIAFTQDLEETSEKPSEDYGLSSRIT